MELYRAFRNIKLRGDFLVRKALNDAVQHLLLAAAYLHSCSKGSPGSQEFLRSLRSRIEERFPGNYQQFVILGCLASHEAVHSKQAGNFFHWHAAIGFCLNSETHRARGTLAQDKALH